MPFLNNAKQCLSLLLLASFSFTAPVAKAEQEAAPIPVAQWKFDDKAAVENPDEMTAEDVEAYLDEKHAAEGDKDEGSRMDFDATKATGKIIIRVHKSSNPAKPEYLAVFRQKSADPSDLEPVNLFDGGTSNQALVSTAGTYGSKTYVTPTGNFSIDTLEVMYHSHKYNNAPMPWSMFFAAGGAIAIHGATPSEFGDLGKKASHGCVRVHPANAKLLFDLVKKEGKQNAVVEVMQG